MLAALRLGEIEFQPNTHPRATPAMSWSSACFAIVITTLPALLEAASCRPGSKRGSFCRRSVRSSAHWALSLASLHAGG
jgi:hypothetical protein